MTIDQLTDAMYRIILSISRTDSIRIPHIKEALYTVINELQGSGGGGGNGNISPEMMSKINVPQKPETFTKTTSNTFTLSKPPAFISQILISDINNDFLYLQETDYSLSGSSLTILDSNFTEGMRIKVDYSVSLLNL